MEDYIERKESDCGVYLYGRGVCRPGSRALEQKKKKKGPSECANAIVGRTSQVDIHSTAYVV